MCSTPPKPSDAAAFRNRIRWSIAAGLVEEASRRDGQAVEVREVGPAVVLPRQIEELDEGVHREQLVVGGVLDDVRTEDATGALRAGVGVHRHGPPALAGIGDHHVVVLDVLHQRDHLAAEGELHVREQERGLRVVERQDQLEQLRPGDRTFGPDLEPVAEDAATPCGRLEFGGDHHGVQCRHSVVASEIDDVIDRSDRDATEQVRDRPTVVLVIRCHISPPPGVMEVSNPLGPWPDIQRRSQCASSLQEPAVRSAPGSFPN